MKRDYIEISGWAISVSLVFEERQPADALQRAILDLVRLGCGARTQVEEQLAGVPLPILRGAIDELVLERLHEDEVTGLLTVPEEVGEHLVERREGWAFWDSQIASAMLPIILLGASRPQRDARQVPEGQRLIVGTTTATSSAPKVDAVDDALRTLVLRDDLLLVDERGVQGDDARALRLLSIERSERQWSRQELVVPFELRPALGASPNFAFWKPDVAVCSELRTAPLASGAERVRKAMPATWDLLEALWRQDHGAHLLPLLQRIGCDSLEAAQAKAERSVSDRLRGATDGEFVTPQLRALARDALVDAWLLDDEGPLRPARAWSAVLEVLAQRLLARVGRAARAWPKEAGPDEVRSRLEDLGDLGPSRPHLLHAAKRASLPAELRRKFDSGSVGVGDAISLWVFTAVLDSPERERHASTLRRLPPSWWRRIDQARAWRDDATHVRASDLPTAAAFEACIFDVWCGLLKAA